jgi:M6 family metalloprotease-like protein
MRKILWVVTLLLTSLAFQVQAAYFKFQPYTIHQPDGQEIRCFVSGDEYFNWLHDKDGYTIIQDSDGYFYYGVTSGDVVIPSPYKVNSIDPAAQGLEKWARISVKEYNRKKEFYSLHVNKSVKAPHEGTENNIVIYIHFNDDPEFSVSRQTFDDKFNPPTGTSLKSYYTEVSYNNLLISSTHYPACAMNTNYSYKDSHNRDYFEPYNATTNPNGYQGDERTAREHTLLRDAVNWINANSPVPTDLNIDGDDDGFVDNVCFIIEGPNGAWADLLWAHRWVLFSIPVYINGKQVWDYTFQPQSQVDVTTLCHEMFHSLGSPDLYHYSYDGFSPVGTWDIMEGGSGSMSSYMKWRYAGNVWVPEMPTITKSGKYWLQPLQSPVHNCYQIACPYDPIQFFVVEYRKAEGIFEKSLPGSGLLIYRIDPSVNGNASGPPDEVYAFRPGGTHTTNGNVNYAAFSAESGRTALNDSTNPTSFLQDGSPGGLNISNVTSAGDSISFVVNLSLIKRPVPFAAMAISSVQNHLNWDKNISGDGVMIAYNLTPDFGFPDDGVDYPVCSKIPGGGTVIYKGDDTVLEHLALSTNTTYYYAAWSLTNDGYYSPASFCSATTFCEALHGLPYTEDFEDNSTTKTCWTQENANPAWQFIQGNGTGAGYGFPSVSHSGTRNALLKDMTTADNLNKLYSPIVDLTGYTDVQLSFWLFMERWASRQDELKVYYRNSTDEPWTLLQAYSSSISTWTQENLPLPAISASFQLAFEGNAKQGFGICVDDVEITGTSTYTLNLTPSTQEVSPAAGSVNFELTSNTNWSAVSDTSWCSVTSSGTGSGQLTATYTENFSAETRTAAITVTVDELPPQTITVIQRGRGVSVPEADKEQVTIFPNPSHGTISIKAGGTAGHDVVVVMLDLTGRSVLTSSMKSGKEQHFDLSAFQQGIYFVEVKTENSVIVRRLVLTR